MAAAAPAPVAPLFHEERRPSTRLVRTLRMGSWVLTGLCLVALALLHAAWPWYAAALSLGLAFEWWLWTTRFELQLKADALLLRQAPWPARLVDRQDIVGATPHMSYPWGFHGRLSRPYRTPGVEAFATSLGSGVVIELKGGHALWLNCDRAEELAHLLRRPPRRSRRAPAAAKLS